ncbi:MAG: hypothetical protein JXB39_09460 [Deltaproteobacteria bacterium]|nr:hypothetical protein [Deltaproteobacteria bacterium]
MPALLFSLPFLFSACGDTGDDTGDDTGGESSAETWVRAIIDGVAYERSAAESLLLVDWHPNRIQVFSGDNLNAVVYRWEGNGYQSWALQPIEEEKDPGLFWWPHGGVQWWSIDGVFEITRFEKNPRYGPGDHRIGWAEGTFEATLSDVLTGRNTLEVEDGAYRTVLRHGEGE